MRFLGWRPGFVLVLATGCGAPADFPREPVRGSVRLDNEPLADGLISFVPVGRDEPIASGVVQKGAYSIEREHGPAPGPHQVSITSTQPTGKKRKNPDDPEHDIVETRETIPAKYNLNTELQVEIKAGGPNSHDFELQGKSAPGTKKQGKS